MSKILVVGAGYAGLTAAWQAAVRGHAVELIAKGWGATHWLSGCIDVLGFHPLDIPEPLDSPASGIDALIVDNPHHPYALLGKESIGAALAAIQELCAGAGYPLHGDIGRNWLLPSGVGTARPACLAPSTMIGGDLTKDDAMLIVGFKQLADFYPALIADNLARLGIPTAHITLDLPALQQRNNTAPAMLAMLMESGDFQAQVTDALKPHLNKAARIGFPAVLGQKPDLKVMSELEKRSGRPVFEIPALTPSAPGMRLQQILVGAIRAEGGRVTPGIEALGADSEDGMVTAVNSMIPGRKVAHRADHYVLATGGILGGGITTDYRGNISETVFDLPLSAPGNHTEWFHLDFLDSRGHPIYRSGVNVNKKLQPLNGRAAPLYNNLSVVGTTLAHAEVVRERSFEGVAISTAYAAAGML